MATFGERLKQARLRAGLTQERLGVLAGMEQATASPRMNQYERDVHQPTAATARQLASALNVPVAFLYADDDVDAEMLLVLHALPDGDRQAALEALRAAFAPSE